MNLIEVDSASLAKDFIEMAPQFYKEDANYIRPIDADIEKVFDPSHNNFFSEGECVRWLLRDSSGRYIGRIAAFYTKQTGDGSEMPAGGSGFFECINNQDAANMLFDAARDWLQSKGLEAMDGPVNFGERNNWWGLLVEGFHKPCYMCNYNPRYYQDLFEGYGFQVYYKQHTYWRDVRSELDTRYAERAKKILEHRGYTFAHVDKSKLEKAALDFRTVYNKAWVKHAGVSEISEKQANDLLKSMKPILDPRLIWFAYYNGEPVAFWISLPDVNELIVQKLNGKFTLWGKLLFVWRKLTNQCKTMFGVIFGVVPVHQKKGVEIALIVESAKLVQSESMPYTELQMNWIGDFNPRMMRVAEQIGAKIYKTHHTYRYLFDRTIPFERYPII